MPVLAAAALVGCGSSSSGPHEASAPTAAAPTAVTTVGGSQDQAAHPHLARACSRRALGILAGYGSVRPASYIAPSGDRGCHFEGSGGNPDAIVELDSAPQAYVRMEREQVEYWQNVEWSHRAARAAPRPVGHLGLGAYWFPAQGRLLSTDGVRMVTVKVHSPSASAERKSLAVRLSRVYLGPPHPPPGY